MDEDDPLVKSAHDSPAAFQAALAERVGELLREQRAVRHLAVHSPATPKRLRPKVEVPLVRVMADPMGTLGHAPRPRKRGKRA